MKTIRFSLIAMAAVFFALGLSPAALAFHDDGVAHCDGCHTMHNSQNGDPNSLGPEPGDYLLKGQDPSSTCLNCHSGYGQFTNGNGYGSGGDYYWLTKTFSWSAHGRSAQSTGDSHGHNIIAAGFGLENDDGELGLIPPGDTVSLPARLACSSCHDPHGKQGNPLLLYGDEETRGGKDFDYPAPVLESPGRRTISTSDDSVSDTNHAAYGSGVSEWCANCHAGLVGAAKMHPVDQMIGSTLADNYNKYVSTDVIEPGNGVYWEHVPFETGQAQEDLDITSEAGPTSASKVMCLTCHRAHASAFPDIGRWYFPATFVNVESRPLGASPPPGESPDDGSAEDVANKYYGKVWTDEQRSLCNKCHIND